MFETALQKLGLTLSETRVYLALLKCGESSVTDITSETGIHRRNVYDILNSLMDRGLIFLIVKERENRYGAVEPDKLIELIRSKEIILNSVLPDLKQSFKKEFKKERAVIYKGVDGFKKYLEEILLVGENIYCLGAKGGWGAEALGSTREAFEAERIRRKIKVFNLFDHDMKPILEGRRPLYNTLSECRFLPKEQSTNSALDTFGDRVVTFTGLYPERFDNDVTIFVIVSHDLAEAQRIWFKCMWDAVSS